MPQVALQRIIQTGVNTLKANIDILDDVFEYFTCPQMDSDYGQAHIEKIKTWFTITKIPVVQAWSFNPDRIPMISIHLTSESEDESKSAIGDHWGFGEDGEVGVGVFNTQLDIGCHTSRNGDEALWLYYIVNYILFKNKRLAEELGLQLHTFNATEHAKQSQYMADNIWTKWIRFRATVQNFWEGNPFIDIDAVEAEPVVDGYNNPNDGSSTDPLDSDVSPTLERKDLLDTLGIPGPYEDDAEATLNGVLPGEQYYDNTLSIQEI